MKKGFNTFYYTDSAIQDKRTLSLLSIVCDSVHLHYMSPDYYFTQFQERWEKEKELPVFKKRSVEISTITSKYSNEYIKFLEENKDLIDAEIIQPIQTSMKPPDWESLEQYGEILGENDSAFKFTDFGIRARIIPKDKIYIDSPYFSLYRIQSSCASFCFALESQITPISDNPLLSSIVQSSMNRYSGLKLEYTYEDLSKILAFKTLSSTLPNFGSLTCEQIFEIREYM